MLTRVEILSNTVIPSDMNERDNLLFGISLTRLVIGSRLAVSQLPGRPLSRYSAGCYVKLHSNKLRQPTTLPDSGCEADHAGPAFARRKLPKPRYSPTCLTSIHACSPPHGQRATQTRIHQPALHGPGANPRRAAPHQADSHRPEPHGRESINRRAFSSAGAGSDQPLH